MDEQLREMTQDEKGMWLACFLACLIGNSSLPDGSTVQWAENEADLAFDALKRRGIV